MKTHDNYILMLEARRDYFLEKKEYINHLRRKAISAMRAYNVEKGKEIWLQEQIDETENLIKTLKNK